MPRLPLLLLCATAAADYATPEYLAVHPHPAVSARNFSAVAPPGREVTRIAFVGNSYTYYQDLPEVLKDLAAAVGETLHFEQHTPGGSALYEHALPGGRYGEQTAAMLGREAWDYVVLQDQSQSPGGGRVTSGTTQPEGEAKRLSLAALGEYFRARVGAARPVLYSTWGRRDGDPSNPTIYPDFLEMNRRTTEGYAEYAGAVSRRGRRRALVAPAGAAFELVWHDGAAAARNATAAETEFRALYYSQADGSHPSLRGTYLAACVFLGTVWGHSPVGVSYHPAGIPAAEAEYLQRVAARALHLR